MDISIMIEGQEGINWAHWQRLAAEVEQLGFAGMFRSDHFTNAGPPDKDSLEMVVSLAYLALLFVVAYVGDRWAARGRSLVSSPWTYALSLGVYCTAWTYFGSVGRAASGGLWFLPIYLGPTMAMVLGWVVLPRTPAPPRRGGSVPRPPRCPHCP